MDLEDINVQNKEILLQNQALSKIIYDTDIAHYRRPTIEEAQKYSEYLKHENSLLRNKVMDIYDL